LLLRTLPINNNAELEDVQTFNKVIKRVGSNDSDMRVRNQATDTNSFVQIAGASLNKHLGNDTNTSLSLPKFAPHLFDTQHELYGASPVSSMCSTDVLNPLFPAQEKTNSGTLGGQAWRHGWGREGSVR